MTYTATYSPEDNKIRLSASSRLDAETYARVRAAGFSWAPKQGIFVAPMWTPQREDLAIELAGEIDDEDTTLVERAEERADRFEGYRENRTADADSARQAVARIADGIPMGQPILVGHHSERHARRDAEKIENGMRRAVRMWETANYWKSRAAGAIRAAKYKELPAVRARRIKTIEADLRAAVASYTRRPGQADILQHCWDAKPEDAPIPHAWVGPAGRGGRWVPAEDLPKIEARAQRWLRHYENRLTYERAMLAEGGGLVADQFQIEVGGRVSGGGDWYVVTGLNSKEGRLLSVSVIGRWCSVLPVEEIRDYQPPKAGDAEKVKAVKKLAPLTNFRAPGCVEMTTAEWKQRTKWSDSYYVANFAVDGSDVYRGYVHGEGEKKPIAYRLRTASGGGSRNYARVPVFLTDSKVVEPPKITALVEPVKFDRPAPAVREYAPREVEPEAAPFEAMKESLKAGVQVVSAPQLFPTPATLAARMVEEAALGPQDRILEPSAGTGRILDAMRYSDWLEPGDASGQVVAVEVNHSLAESLRVHYSGVSVRCADFLECNGDLGKFDRVIMNPPFADGQDIAHIQHAAKFLKPGGRLVAICADGPRQNAKLKPWVEANGGTWEQLPNDTFAASGTGVRTVLLTMEAQ